MRSKIPTIYNQFPFWVQVWNECWHIQSGHPNQAEALAEAKSYSRLRESRAVRILQHATNTVVWNNGRSCSSKRRGYNP